MLKSTTVLICDVCKKIIAEISSTDTLDCPVHFYTVYVKYPAIIDKDEYSICRSVDCLSKLLEEDIFTSSGYPESINIENAVFVRNKKNFSGKNVFSPNFCHVEEYSEYDKFSPNFCSMEEYSEYDKLT